MSFRWNPLSRREPKVRRKVAKAPARGQQNRRRLLLETLEGRIVLSNSIPVSSAQWTTFGPAPILNGETPGNLPVSGRITGIAASPTDASTIYVATAGGGVWKTSNGGGNWTALTDTQSTLFMGSIAIAPSSTNVIYAGTGESNNTIDSFYGRGILKSTDGGNSWTLETNNGAFDRLGVSKIVVDPTDANIVYAAVTDNVMNGLNTGTGIFKSTDGGATWIDTTAGISTTDQYTDLVMDPKNPSTLYAAIGSVGGGAANGVYASTDAGASWKIVGAGLPSGAGDGRITLAIGAPAAGGPSTLLAAILVPGTSGGSSGTLLKLEKSLDGGNTWTDLTGNVGNYFQDAQGWAHSALAVEPGNPNILFAGGSDSGSAAGKQHGIVESRDGGATWTSIDQDPLGNGPHTGHTSFAFDANGRLLDGTFGGIFRLNNANFLPPSQIAWNDLNGNLAITQFVGIALDPTDPNIAYGGSQDNGTEKFNDSTQWISIRKADGGVVRVDPTNPQIVYHTFQSTTGVGFFERSTDGGLNWTPESAGINLGTSTPDASQFYTPFVIDPSNHTRLVLGTDRVYETKNSGALWAPISTPATNGWTDPATATITSIAVAPSSPNTIYATTSLGHVFVTNDDGATWNMRNVTGVTDTLTGLVVDRSDPNVAYVVRNAFDSLTGIGKVFTTVNGGLSWTDITGNLPDLPTWSIAVDSTQAPTTTRLFVGTDNGVFASVDGGTTWAPFQSGLPNVQVTSLELNTNLNILAAGTHGRGLYEIKEINPLQVVPASPPLAVEGVAFANARIATFTDGGNPDPLTNYSATINWGDNKATSVGTITPTGNSSFTVKGSHTYAEEGPETITITIVDTDGDMATATANIVVGDATLTASTGFTLATTEGTAVGGTIGTFTDANTAAPISDFTAQVDWGDGHVTAASLAADPKISGRFDVIGSNTYAEEGSYPVSVTVTDRGGSSTSIFGSATVANAPLTAAGVSASAIEGTAFSGFVATFTDADTQGALSDYTATITWGDGQTSDGIVGTSGSGGFNVTGSHAYSEEGTYTTSTTITDNSQFDPSFNFVAQAQSTATVSDAPLSAIATDVTATEGLPLAQGGIAAPVIATFSDADPNTTLSDFAPVTIHWGDGATSLGTLGTLSGTSTFTISGDHVYLEEGTYIISASIVDNGDGRSLTDPTDARVTATATATVLDSTLSTNNATVTGTEGQPVSGSSDLTITGPSGQTLPVVATFTDLNTFAPISDYTVVINWGDGTIAQPDLSAGVLSQPGGVGTLFEVGGSNVYKKAGTYSITVTISDKGGSTAQAISTANIADAPLSGSIAPLPTLLEGGTFTGVVATFNDANTTATPADFLAPITFGDGNSALGTIIPLGGGKFAISSSNTYNLPGAYTLTVNVIDLGGSRLTLQGVVQVADSPIAVIPAAAVQTTEGSVFSGLVASFTQQPNSQASSFAATIRWGNGTNSPGQVVALGQGRFGVTGSNIFAEEGQYPIGVTVTDLFGTSGTTSLSATVVDAPLSASAFNLGALSNQAFSGAVAQFTDANANAPVSDFTATINWGNGNITPGQVTAVGGGVFQVSGSNTFGANGNYPLLVTVSDIGGSSASAQAGTHVLQGLTGVLLTPLITNNNVPLFAGTAEPNTIIDLFARSIDSVTATPLVLGQAITNAAGQWSFTSPALADGRYAITATMLDATGTTTLQTLQIVPLPGQSPLIIDTASPTVAGAVFLPGQGKLLISYQDSLDAMNPVGLVNTANVSLRLVSGRSPKTYQATGVSLVAGAAGSGLTTQVLNYNFAGKVTPGVYVLTIHVNNLSDLAGNVVVEKNFVTFPQTSNSPNPDYVAQFTVGKNGQASTPQQYISQAEQNAAGRFARFARSHTKIRRPL